tara:strand:- start:1626 stop:2756 length:1131 start_codon:yes stop_codon:yes gene_type:complete
MRDSNLIFRMGHAAESDWESLTNSCLAQLEPCPKGSNLGFVYVTDILEEDFPLIADKLRDKTGIEDWVGTVGFGVMVGGKEYFDLPAIVSMVGSFPEESFRIFPTIEKPGDPLPAVIIEWARRVKPSIGIVHADPRNAYILDILNSLTDDTEAYLVGGITASRGRPLQIATKLTEGGVSGVFFSEDVLVLTGLSQGCRPISDIHSVTNAQDNVIFELNGKPAYDVFCADIGQALSRNLGKVGNYVHVALPVSGDDSGDYLVRNIVGIDPQNKVIAVGERVARGDRLIFVKRDGQTAMDDLNRMLADLKNKLSSPPKAALYYSCVARGPNLFGPESAELKAVQAAIGEQTPLVGFFANGEISKNRLYGYTGVLTLFY